MADATTTTAPPPTATVSGGVDQASFQKFMQLITGGGGTGTDTGSNVASGIGGIIDLILGLKGQATNQGNTAANMADPLNKYRSGAADQLNTLINDPSSVTKTPGYQFGLDQAEEAAQRAMGPSGLLNSGNRFLGTADLAERYEQSQYQQQFNNLLGVASGSPTAAAAAYQQGNTNKSNQIGAGIGSIFGTGGLASIINLLGQAGSGIGGGLSNLWKMISGGGSPTQGPDGGGGVNDPSNTGGDPSGGSTTDTTWQNWLFQNNSGGDPWLDAGGT